ncbi:MAG TPA: hypothetical protein VGP77_00255 [Vicinamibacterales bacterium]|jgi:hypothetical protein|nr:hypothetical protein [Vicinamibacterales bacterium]
MIGTDARTQVLFVMPVFQAVYPKPLENFLAMMLHAGMAVHEKYAIWPIVMERTPLHAAMNRAAADALTHGFDVLIFADDDCLPPIDAIPRLLAHYEAGHPFMAGLGYMRGFPHTTTIGRYDPAGPTLRFEHGQPQLAGFRWIDDVADEPTDLIPADFCGFPIAMVTVAALRRMERPWFATATALGECTHDVFFGDRAKAAGVPIVVDRTMACGHLSDGYVITPHSRQLARTLQPLTDGVPA